MHFYFEGAFQKKNQIIEIINENNHVLSLIFQKQKIKLKQKKKRTKTKKIEINFFDLI